MSKVKYPDKKEIERQICTIIDRSQIFDEKDDSSIFTEVKPVRRSNYGSRAFAVGSKVVVSAAAVLLAVFLTKGIVGSVSVTRQQAMNTGANASAYNQLSEDTAQDGYTQIENSQANAAKISGINELTVNASVTVKYSKYSSTVVAEDNSTVLARINMSYPKIYIEGKALENANLLYELKSTTINLDANNRYREYYAQTGYNGSEGVINFNTVYSECGYLNSNTVSFYSNYIESSSQEDGSSSTVRIYGANFDAGSDKQLTYRDIFVNYDEAMQYITAAVYEEMQVRSANSGVGEEYATYESIAEKLEKDNNFYFTQSGIVVCCNGFMISESEQNGLTQNMESPGSVLVEFDSLREKGIVFNSDYIEF